MILTLRASEKPVSAIAHVPRAMAETSNPLSPRELRSIVRQNPIAPLKGMFLKQGVLVYQKPSNPSHGGPWRQG